MVEKSHPQSRIGSGNSSIRTYRRRPDMFVCRDLFLAVEPSVEQYIQNPGWLSYIGVYTYHTHLYRDYSISHDIRIPFLTSQDSMECHKGFDYCLNGVITLIHGRNTKVGHWGYNRYIWSYKPT